MPPLAAAGAGQDAGINTDTRWIPGCCREGHLGDWKRVSHHVAGDLAGRQYVVRPEETWIDLTAPGEHCVRLVVAPKRAKHRRQCRTVSQMERICLHREIELLDRFVDTPRTQKTAPAENHAGEWRDDAAAGCEGELTVGLAPVVIVYGRDQRQR